MKAVNVNVSCQQSVQCSGQRSWSGTVGHHFDSVRQAHREPQQGLGKHSHVAPKHFHGALWGKNLLIVLFLFKRVHSNVLYISGRQWAPKRRGTWGSLPPTPPS